MRREAKVRVVVVDDEYSQLRLWRDILFKYCPEYEIVTFGDSVEAMDYLLEQGADVLLLDIKMPGMNGFELLSHLLWDDSMMVVIISAHNDFEYARMAIRKGVNEYLLKPISRKEIEHLILQIRNHMEKIEKKQLELEESNRSLRKMSDFVKALDLNRLILKWVEQPLNDDEKNGILHLFSCKTGFITVVRLVQRKKIHRVYSPGYLQYFIMPRLQQMLYRSLYPYGKILIGIGDWRKLEIVIAVGDSSPAKHRQTKQLLDVCRKQADQEWGIEFAAGVSAISEDIQEGVRVCYKQAVKALQCGYVTGQSMCQIYNAEMEKEVQDDPLQYFDECLRECAGWKAAGEGQLKEAVRCGFDAIQDKGAAIDMEELSRKMAYLMRNGARYVSDYYQTENGNYMMQKIERTLLDEENTADLCESLITAIEQIFSVPRDDTAADMLEIVNRCRAYLKEHCAQQVSLADLSDYVHFSPSYVSSMFKTFMGVGYKEYLTRIRIERACEMLKTSNLKVYEIASQSGYNDYVSFVKSFKKEIGITPQKYRRAAHDSKRNKEGTGGMVV